MMKIFSFQGVNVILWLYNNKQRHEILDSPMLLFNKQNQLHSSTAHFPFHCKSLTSVKMRTQVSCQSKRFLLNFGFIPAQYLQCVNSDNFLFFSILLFFLFFFITNVVTGDQSPSSPSSRWPGANSGNRTLGVCIQLLKVTQIQHHPVSYIALLLAA